MLINDSDPPAAGIQIRHGLKPVCSDLDRRIWEAMAGFMEETGDEEFVHGNWLALPSDRKYGLILADGALNMLSEEDAEPFLAKTAEVLGESGVSVQRIMFANPSLRVPDFIRAVEEYRANHHPMSLHMYTILLVNSIRENEYPHLSKEELFEQVLFDHLTREEADSIRPFLYGGTLYFPMRDELNQMLDKHFHVADVIECRGLGYWDMGAQYVLRRKA